MTKKILSLLCPLYFTITLFFLSGCIPVTRFKKSTRIEIKPDTLAQEKTASKLIIKKPAIDTLALIDSLVQQAHSNLAKADIPLAHAILMEVIHLIERKEEIPEGESDSLTQYLFQIADIYLAAFPKDYLDSLPVNFNNLIFRYQISMSIDTISLSAEDSSIILGLDCEEGVPYNVPIVHNKRVQKALYVVASRRSRSIERILTRANYYLPFMKKLFADNDMPTDLCYLPILESAFNPKAYSYAHASGIWQFIPSTGRIYGLRSNYWIDERRDPIKSTYAAIMYLKKLYGDFNDWYLALAGYNCGERNVERAIKRAQSNDYWKLKLPRQTMNYVPLFISYQIVAKNPQCFGFKADTLDTFNLDTVHISDCLDMHKISEGLNIPYAELKKINPHIRKWCTPPDMEDITLYLPQGVSDTFRVFYEKLSDKDKVRWYRYRIKSGDNLGNISRRFNISVPAIRSINKLRGNFIIAGRYLYIPLPANGSKPPKNPAIKRKESKKQKSNSYSAEILEFQKKGLIPVKYRIKAGETLSEIAELFNISVQKIRRWNNISNPRRLRAGTVLKLYTTNRQKSINRSKREGKDAPKNMDKHIYTVKRGENLYSISRKVNCSIENLAEWNNKNLSKPVIKPGEKLVYYTNASGKKKQLKKVSAPGGTILYKVKKGDTFYSLAKLYSVDINQILSVNNLNKKSIIKPGDMIHIPSNNNIKRNNNPTNKRIIYYKVKKGDNLWSIANQFGVSVSTIYKANNLTKKSVLMPGKTIRIILSEGS